MQRMPADEGVLIRLRDGTLVVEPTTGAIYSRLFGWNRLLRGAVNTQGYIDIILGVYGKIVTARAHRIVWLSVNGPIPEGIFIDHIDRCRTNNVIANLRLATPAENTLNGLGAGQTSHWAKYSDAQVREVRALCEGGMRPAEVALRFGMSKQHVYRLINKVRYPRLRKLA